MRTPDERAASIAGANDDVVTRDQLLDAGLTRNQIEWRIARRMLIARHPGVYLTSNAPPSLRTRARAAVLACRPLTVVAHDAAAALYVPGRREPSQIEVIAVAHNPGPKQGVKIYRTAHLGRADIRRVDGLPVTAPARLVLDLAATRPRDTVEHVLQELVFRRLVSEPELHQVLERHPGRPGTPMLRSMLGFESGEGFTQSHAERRLLSLLLRAGLPRPQKNVCVCGHRVDNAWPVQRLVVEVDGGRGHDHRLAFGVDRRRDAELVAAGWRVLRFTASQIRDEPLVVVARLAAALAQ